MRLRLYFYTHRRRNGRNPKVSGMSQVRDLKLKENILESFLALKSKIVSLFSLSKALFPNPHVEETG